MLREECWVSQEASRVAESYKRGPPVSQNIPQGPPTRAAQLFNIFNKVDISREKYAWNILLKHKVLNFLHTTLKATLVLNGSKNINRIFLSH